MTLPAFGLWASCSLFPPLRRLCFRQRPSVRSFVREQDNVEFSSDFRETCMIMEYRWRKNPFDFGIYPTRH